MKKFFIFLALAIVLLLILSSCNSRRQENMQEQSPIRVAALRGPTALGLLQLMSESEQDNTRNNYTFELLGSPEQIPPLIARGEVDIAAIPGNLASILYNNLDGDVQALAVVTLGVLHIVDTTGEINSVADLADRTIFAGGQGATPEFALNYILSQNGLTPGVDVIVEFRAEHAEIAAMLETGQAEIAMLPEPFASTVLARVDGLRHALDLTEEWNKIQPEYGLIMSVVIGRRGFLEENPEAVAILLEEYAASIEFMTANLQEAAQLAAYYEIIPNTAIAMQAIPRTHITFLNGETMKRNLLGFYNVLYQAAPQSIGGRMPDEKFFFIP
jgi:NitT/TauT family transport system substrate-binding protein